ncbi:MAG: adenylate/guanylate cyclase domain-containing protein [Pseudomonadota bacterium]
MTRGLRDRLITLLAMVGFGAAVGYVYTSLAYADAPKGADVLRGMLTGALIGGLNSSFEIFGLRNPWWRRVRRWPFLAELGLRAAIHTLLILASLLFIAYLSEIIGWYGGGDEPFDPAATLRDTFFSFLATASAVTVVKVSNLVGARNLLMVLIGRYNRPVTEERLFLMIDLVGSTSLSARLGNEDFHAALSSFFFDLDEPLVANGGQIHAYVGDAVFATWLLKKPGSRLKALDALLACQDRMAERGDWYQQRFGFRPAFRAVLHGGPVVAGECGESHLQIMLLGEVLNATARIEAEAKARKLAVLASAAALADTALPPGLAKTSVGPIALRGLSQPVALFSLERAC